MRNNWKKFLAIILIVVLASLAACGQQSTATSAASTPAPAADPAPAGNDVEPAPVAEPEAFTFSKSVTVVVPFKAGSTSDIQVRLMQKYIEAELGVSLIVENLDGGSGVVGTTTYLNEYAADGQSVLYTLSNPIINKVLTGNTSYTYADDLQAVAMTMNAPYYLVVTDDSPFASAEELFAYIESHPGEIKVANTGTGGPSHLALANLLNHLGFEVVDVPYSGGTADTYSAVMGKECDCYVTGEADLASREGVHGILSFGSQRSTADQFKDIPVVAELGYGGYEAGNLGGFLYHKSVDPAIIAAFDAAVAATLSNEEFLAQAAQASQEFTYASPAEFDAIITTTIDNALPVVEALGLAG